MNYNAMKESYDYKSRDEKLDLPFDLYTRNLLITKLVNHVRAKEKVKILDVGGRGGLLKDFVKEYEYYILDILDSEQKEENYIIGDIRAAPLKNSSFDVVISSDLYEHIPAEDRVKTVSEMLRLSKNFVVLGAPFYSKAVEDAETEANKFFLKNTGEPHPWLKEHIKNGLPLMDELETHLIENGYEYHRLETNNISNWLLLQLFIFYAYTYGIPPEKVSKIYRYYNANFVALGDFLEPTYRKIYLIGERGTLPILEPELKIDKSIDSLKRQNLLSLVFDAIGEHNQGKKSHVHNLDEMINSLKGELQVKGNEIDKVNTIVQEKETHIHNLDGIITGLEGELQVKGEEIDGVNAIVGDKETHIHNLDAIITGLEEELQVKGKEIDLVNTIVREKESRILNLDEIITGLEGELQEKAKEIDRINTIVREKESHIRNLDSAITGLEGKLQVKENEMGMINILVQEKEDLISNLKSTLLSMESSITWQLVAAYHKLIEKLLPLRTRRRHTYDLLLIGLRIIVNEGWRSLWFTLKRRIYQRIPVLNVRKINKPLIETNISNVQKHIPLPLEEELGGKFLFPANKLNELKILTATYQQKNADLILDLRENSMAGPIIRKVRVKWKNILDNDYTSFRFKPIKDSAGKTFSFALKSMGVPSAAVWYDPEISLDAVQLLKNGAVIAGSINFQAFAYLKVKDPYEIWIQRNEPTKEKMDAYKKESRSFNYRPKISIVTPVWNIEEKLLRAAIESVLNQVYDNWELCLVDGGSTKPHVKTILKEYAKNDSRIKVIFLSENKGIAGNSNAALSLATGEFVTFLDHDDELAPVTLYEIVNLLNENPDFDYIYSDDDKIDERGKRKEPFFKPDWSPDTFLSCNYPIHITAIRKSLLDLVNGFRKGYDGSQDYDLFLRVTERIGKNRIAHIPKILYHWRTIATSAASSLEAKPYAYTAAKKALKDAAVRRRIETEDVIDGIWIGSYRFKYKIKGSPKVSIIIPTKDKVDTLKTCIDSIVEKTDYENYELVIVDNQSKEGETFEYYDKIKNNLGIKILDYNKPFNFSAINNFAVSKVDAGYILFLNSDTEVISEEWLSAMLEHAQRSEVGAVGAKLLYPNNTIQHAGIIIGIIGKPPVAGHSHRYFPASHFGYCGRIQHVQNLSAVTAACMMVRKEVFEEVGGFDEHLAVAFNDVDFCLKIREQDYLIVYTPYAELYHYESLSRGYDDNPEKKARFLKEVEYVRA
ncbi:Glycosyltransferase, partial [Methanophagales archaeon]